MCLPCRHIGIGVDDDLYSRSAVLHACLMQMPFRRSILHALSYISGAMMSKLGCGSDTTVGRIRLRSSKQSATNPSPEAEFPPISARRRAWLVRARGCAMSCAGQTPRHKDMHGGVLPPLGVRLKIPFCCLRRCSSHTHPTSWSQALIDLFLHVLFLFSVVPVIHVLAVSPHRHWGG